MAVDVTTSAASVQSGIPRALFDTRIPMNPTVDQYDAAANGQRFLMLKTVGVDTSDPIRVVVNWPALLK